MIYCAGFDVSTLSSLGTLTVDPANGTAVVITLNAQTDTNGNGDASSLFWHGKIISRVRALNTYSFSTSPRESGEQRLLFWSEYGYGTALQASIRAAGLAEGDWTAGASNFTISFDLETGLYTFSYPEDFSLSWSTEEGRYFLGFNSNRSSASVYQSNVQPYYTIYPDTQATHLASPVYELEGVSTLAIADGGPGFALARTTGPLYQEWTQAFESKEKTLRHAATTSHLFTHQDLFAHCRSVYPFLVFGGLGEGDTQGFACRLRNDGNYFDTQGARATPGNDSQFNVPYRVLLEGIIPKPS